MSHLGRPETWTMGGETYPYLEPRLWNERDIETPWACRILGNAHGRVLEVGNATQWITAHPHRTIVDRWDPTPHVTIPLHHTDIVNWHGGPYDLIVSISTLEHVGTDPQEEQDPAKAVVALGHCYGSLLARGGEMAFTVPCGYHPRLQNYVLGSLCDWTDVRLMGRDDQFSTEWRELPLDQADCEFPRWYPPSAKRVLFVRYRKP